MREEVREEEEGNVRMSLWEDSRCDPRGPGEAGTLR